VFDYGGDAAWHVVVAGEQQGPFSPLQIGSMLMESKIDAEAYVWKEGFDGWKALRDVPELAQLTASKGAEPQQVEAEMESDGADLFGSAAKPAAAAAPAGSDLFAGAAASKGASAFAASGEEDDGLVTSKASGPRVSASQASMTGQRNENSVLFSLSNLQALATGPAGPSPSPMSSASSSSSGGSPLGFGGGGGGSSPLARPAAASPAKPVGHAAGEASGLIDIRALAGATSAVAANKPASSSASADDLLAIGTGPSPLAGGFGGPLIAPVVQPKKEEAPAPSKAPMFIGGALIVGLIGAVGFLGYKILNQQPQERVVERVIVQGGGGEGTSNTAPTDTAATGTTGSTTGSTTATTGRTGRTTGTTGTATTVAANTGSTTGTATTGRTTGATTGAPATSTASTTNAMRDLLNMAPATGTTTTARTEEPAMAASNLPATPSRGDVGSALGGVRGAVSACGSGGVANVAVTFRSSGSVSSASVGGDFAGTPVASCISRAVRSARVPPFSNPSFSVTYPYRL